MHFLFQEQYWRSLLFHNHFDFQLSSGYEIDEEQRCKKQKEQQELLMKMFAVSHLSFLHLVHFFLFEF